MEATSRTARFSLLPLVAMGVALVAADRRGRPNRASPALHRNRDRRHRGSGVRRTGERHRLDPEPGGAFANLTGARVVGAYGQGGYRMRLNESDALS